MTENISEKKQSLADIKVTGLNEVAEGTDGTNNRTPDEDWEFSLEKLERFNKSRDWNAALDLLIYLSKKDDHDKLHAAIGQASWLALKLETPIDIVVMSLYNMLLTLGNGHGAAKSVAALANMMTHHRTPDHPDRELAKAQAQQMLHYVSPETGHENQEGFDKWTKENRMDDPDFFVPVVMEVIDGLVRQDWWIDREAIQQELEEANRASNPDS